MTHPSPTAPERLTPDQCRRMEELYRNQIMSPSERLWAKTITALQRELDQAEAQLATRLPTQKELAAYLRDWFARNTNDDGVFLDSHLLADALLSDLFSGLSGAATPAPTLTEEAAREYAGLKPVSAEQIVRWWEEDKRRRAQGFKDDNWSRLLLSILHAFKDLANRDAKIAQLTVAPAPTAALTEEERKVMGTLEEAQATLLEKWRVWTQYTGPTIADRKTHRERDAARREAEVRLREAAATVAWHLDRAKSPPQGAEE